MTAPQNSKWYPVRYMATLIWMGAIIAISFMEAPLKFQAPSITLAVGLEVGRLVFGALNKMEWGFMLLMVGSFFLTSASKKSLILSVLLLCLLLWQTFVLLPDLDQRALAIIDGDLPVPGNEHLFYVGAEIAKLALLTIISIHFIYHNHE